MYKIIVVQGEVMSIIDELLIFADFKGKFKVDDVLKELTKRKKQITCSALGRLVSRGFLKIDNNKNYSISLEGKAIINSNLESIKIYNNIYLDKGWQFVVFDIAEKKRNQRDKLRNSLISLGFGRLQDSIWFSYHDYKIKLDNIIADLDIKNEANYLYTKTMDSNEQKKLVEKLFWNWQLINDGYQDFITAANSFLRNKNKNAFQARKLVYLFAKTIQNDPKLPKILQPKKSLTDQAFIIYNKIREYCY